MLLALPPWVNLTLIGELLCFFASKGGLAGVFEICCTYPIEFVKTTMQLSSTNMSAQDVAKRTITNEGFLGFYRGLPSMVYFAFPKAAIRFSSFETCTSLLTGPPGNEDKYGLGQMKGFIAGLGAGTMEAIFVTTPQETIKVRLINDAFRTDGTKPKYHSFFHGVRSIVGEYGVSGVYKGLGPTIIKVATAQGTRFGVYQMIPAEQVSVQSLNTNFKSYFSHALLSLSYLPFSEKDTPSICRQWSVCWRSISSVVSGHRRCQVQNARFRSWKVQKCLSMRRSNSGK